MDKENKAIKFLYLDLLERSFKYFAIIIGFLYFCGLIITNLHLGRFGISNISILRIQYIITGFDFMLFLFLPFLAIISPILVLRIMGKNFHKENKFMKIFIIVEMILIAISSIVTIFFIHALLIFGTIDVSIRMTLETYFDLLWIWCLILFYFSIVNIFEFRYKKNFVSISIAFCVFVCCMSIYQSKIHPKVHSAFAGGRPIFSDILISEDGISIVESLGINLDDKGHIRNIKIIHESPSMIYLIPKKEEQEKIKSIGLPKNIVKGIKFLTEETEKKPKGK